MFATPPTATTVMAPSMWSLGVVLGIDQPDAGGARLQALDRPGIRKDFDPRRLQCAPDRCGNVLVFAHQDPWRDFEQRDA